MAKKLNPAVPPAHHPVPPKESARREPEKHEAGSSSEQSPRASRLASGFSNHREMAGWLDGGQAIIDSKGRVTEINEALSSWLGRPADAITGHPFWELLVEHCAAWREPIDAFCQKTDVFSELKLRLPPWETRGEESEVR